MLALRLRQRLDQRVEKGAQFRRIVYNLRKHRAFLLLNKVSCEFHSLLRKRPMREALADLIQTANSKSLTENLKRPRKWLVSTACFRQCPADLLRRRCSNTRGSLRDSQGS